MQLEGLQRIGRYFLIRRIGGGGAGIVYLAQDTHMSIRREVAVKVITPSDDPAEAKRMIELFLREVIAVSQLNHPHILPLSDYGTETVGRITYAYLVMPYCRAGSLAEWMKYPGNRALCSPQNVAYFIQQAAAALQEAHDHNIFHKDTKPHNFLLRRSIVRPELPELLLTDFGMVKLNTGAAKTLGNLVAGTPGYMPPEQWIGDPVAASDQYALAIMAYELLTGQRPFQGDIQELAKLHLNTPPPLPTAFAPGLPKAIDSVILRALAKEPEDRYPSISEFAREFTQAARSGEKGQDISMTLVVSTTEARLGTECSLALEEKGQLKVIVPKDAQNGQVLVLEGMGKASSYGGPAGNLLVTITTRPDTPGVQLVTNHISTLSERLDRLEANATTRNRSIIEQLQSLWTSLTDLQSNQSSTDKFILISIIIEIIIISIIIISGFFLYFGIGNLLGK